jgi:hypothetical protein
VAQNDVFRLHSNLLRSMLLNAHDCQMPADPHHGGVSRSGFA